MRKFIILIMVIGLVGSASAAEVTYHFAAQITGYDDATGIFGQLGYTDSMPLEGTITYDPEAVVTNSYPLATMTMSLYYDQGLLAFSNQAYEWEGGGSRLWVIKSYVQGADGVPFHTMEIQTTQAGLVNSSGETVEGIAEVAQKVTLENEGWNVTLPEELVLGNSGHYNMSILKADGSGSTLSATITAIMSEDEYNASQLPPDIEDDAGAGAVRAQLKPQFRTRKNETLYKRIKSANDKLKDGNPSNDKAAMKELQAFNRQVEKRMARNEIKAEEYQAFQEQLAPVKGDGDVSDRGKKKK